MKSTTFGRAVSNRAGLLLGVAAVSLMLPGMANAQNAEPAAADTTADSTPQDGNEIVVTATKREQTLQSTPVAVSVTTAATIERAQIRDVMDLQTVVPSLRVTQSNGQFATTYNIRGFGTSGNNIGLEPSVAMFVDGVYRSRAVAQVSDLPDIQRVEVLRGPQSTLFGKNASAGVISIVTQQPKFNFGGNLEASYGNYNAVVVKGVVTGPLSDTVAASVAAGYNRRDGYLLNGATGTKLNNRNRYFVRGQLLFQPSSDLKVRLIADYDRIDEICCGVSNFQTSAATAAIQALGGRVNDPATPFANVVYSDVDPASKVRNWGLSGQVDYTSGPLTFTSITAYRDTQLSATQDVDFSSAKAATGSNIGQASLKTFTEEFRVASKFDGPLNFLLGAYYFHENATSGSQIVYGPDFRPYANLLVQGLSAGKLSIPSFEALTGTPAGSSFATGQGLFANFTQKDESYSLFGNVDYKFGDKLTLTLGANYTHDSKDVVSNVNSTDTFAAIDLAVAGAGVVRNQGIATNVGVAIGLPTGTLASAAQIGAFAGAQPTIYANIVAGSTAFANANANNPAVNPFLGLKALQFLPPFRNFPNAVESGKSRDGDWSYTARLALEATDTVNVYASYSTGFKATSFNLSRDSRPTPGDLISLNAAGLGLVNLTSGTRFSRPEKSSVYELGIKGNWGVASANLTVFQQTIKNFQANNFTGTGYVFTNADKESTFGIEFDGRVNPTRELTFTLAVTYLDAKYDQYTNSPFGDVSGTKPVDVVPLTASFGMQWDHQLTNDDHLIFRGDYHVESVTQPEPGLFYAITKNADGSNNYTAARQAASIFKRQNVDLGLSLTYAMHNGLEITAWGRNVLNHRTISDIFDSVAQSGSVSGYVNQPRTFGGSVRFKF